MVKLYHLKKLVMKKMKWLRNDWMLAEKTLRGRMMTDLEEGFLLKMVELLVGVLVGALVGAHVTVQ